MTAASELTFIARPTHCHVTTSYQQQSCLNVHTHHRMRLAMYRSVESFCLFPVCVLKNDLLVMHLPSPPAPNPTYRCLVKHQLSMWLTRLCWNHLTMLKVTGPVNGVFAFVLLGLWPVRNPVYTHPLFMCLNRTPIEKVTFLLFDYIVTHINA